MIPFLPSDCLREIFKHMQGISGSQREERKSLLSCLLVNRLWCETAVEILWRNPWRLGNFYTDDNYWISLSKTIFLCLSKEQKEVIKKNGINLKPSITKQQPLFNYISNIQCLSNEHIVKVVKTLTNENNLTIVLWNYNANIIENELWKLFMSNCSSVKYLELPSTSIFHFLGANNCLATLSEFECSTYSSSKLFLDLAQVCRNIKKMIINPCGDDNEGLETLISLQNNLQQVRLCSIEGDICQKIGKALETQSKSLTSIIFEFSICIPVSTLCNLTELKTLNIFVKDIDSDLEELICATLPKLESLEILNSAYQPLDLYTSLIQTTLGFLRKIHFRTTPHPSEGEIQPYIQSIINYCPNIEDITLWYIEEIYDDLEQLLSSCKSIKYISLEALSTFSNLEETWWGDDDDNDDDDNQENIDLDWTLACDAAPIFDLFIEKFPRNLVQLNLSGSWRFNALELETFLKLWKGRNPLFLRLMCDFDMGDEYFNILNDFQSNGTIKVSPSSDRNYTCKVCVARSIKFVADEARVGSDDLKDYENFPGNLATILARDREVVAVSLKPYTNECVVQITKNGIWHKDNIIKGYVKSISKDAPIDISEVWKMEEAKSLFDVVMK
ncbi:hypothetical protein C1645_879330 [Glomus cerebriforme]|uniref:F-box domain-containing protein n=1 Tax=Glomus cerebriforme TaxID=658196 RepID=A0A397SN50_9GLOM|nr:hypothetical protein C1645_879330 [Glomus cerebriforme]